MSDETTIITVRFKMPLTEIFDFRSRLTGRYGSEEFRAEQQGSDAVVEVDLPRETARNLDLPQYAERLD